MQPQNPIGTPFIELQSVDSTNNYARHLIYEDKAQHGMVIFSHEQWAGKGQRGKKWESGSGLNICMSIIIKPEAISHSQQFQLNACFAVAVHEFFMKYATHETRIKWPNDLYWRERKAGGILIESVFRGRAEEPGSWQWAIAGIGININQTFFPDSLPNPVSLKQITGLHYVPLQLACELCQIIDRYYQELITKGPENICRIYNHYLYKLHQTARLKKQNRIFEAVVKGVTPSGNLVIQHAVEEELDYGEVEWLLI